MMELLALYWPTLLAASVSSAALALSGAFLANRHTAIQVLPVGQGASLGVQLGVLFTLAYVHDDHLEHTTIPLLSGVAVSAITFLGFERIARASHSKTAVYVALYALMWALNYLLAGFFPALEAHAAALFFGDIVTLSASKSFLFLAIAGVALVFLAATWRTQAKRAFAASVFDEPLALGARQDLAFHVCTLVLICLSVQFLGLLFTVAALFLPTAILSFSTRVGVGPHLRDVAALATLATASGFLLSLLEPRFSTTPLIVALLAVYPVLWLFLLQFICNLGKTAP